MVFRGWRAVGPLNPSAPPGVLRVSAWPYHPMVASRVVFPTGYDDYIGPLAPWGDGRHGLGLSGSQGITLQESGRARGARGRAATAASIFEEAKRNETLE